MYDIVHYRGNGYLVIQRNYDTWLWEVHSAHEDADTAVLIVEALKARARACED